MTEPQEHVVRSPVRYSGKHCDAASFRAPSAPGHDLVRGRPEDLDRLLDEAVAQVEGWRPPRGA